MRKKNKNKLIGPKYNVAAWERFGSTKKLKGGFGVDGKEVEGTLKLKGSRKKNNTKIKFKEEGKLFYRSLTRDK